MDEEETVKKCHEALDELLRQGVATFASDMTDFPPPVITIKRDFRNRIIASMTIKAIVPK